MQVIISAVGPDNRGLADPIIHHVTGLGANIAEIQMYDHDEECLFAMLLRIELDGTHFAELKSAHFATPTVEELARAGQHGVGLKYIRDMAVAGFPPGPFRRVHKGR